MCERVELTAVVIDEVLQGAELRARGDVEAAAVQLPDLVVLHVQPFGVVIVQHRQTVGTCRRAPPMRARSTRSPARGQHLSSRKPVSSLDSRSCLPLPGTFELGDVAWWLHSS